MRIVIVNLLRLLAVAVLLSNVVYGQGGRGEFQTTSSATCSAHIKNPVANQTWCRDATTGSYYVYNGSSWVQIAGPSTFGSANQILGINAAGTALEYKTITAVASETDVTHSAGGVTIGIVNPLAASKGGTGQDTSASTGTARADGGTWSVGNLKAEGVATASLPTGAGILVRITDGACANALSLGDGSAAGTPDQRAKILTLTCPPYNAKGDLTETATGFTATAGGDATFTCTACGLTATNVGNVIMIKGGGAAGVVKITTIATVTGATAGTLTSDVDTSVSGVRAQWGTDDTTAVQAALDDADSATGFQDVIINGAGKSYLISAQLTYNDTTKSRTIQFVNGRIVRKPAVDIQNIQLSQGGWAIFSPGFICDGNSRMEHTGTTMRKPCLAPHNVKHFRFNAEVLDATGYGIGAYQQGDGTNQDTETFDIIGAKISAWEGGFGLFNAGSPTEVVYRINRNFIDCSTVHPNSAGLSLTGCYGIIPEVENLPVATQKIQRFEAIGNFILAGGTAASNGSGIVHSGSTATLNILHSVITDNTIVATQTEMTYGVSWENPCETDTAAANDGCTNEISRNKIVLKSSNTGILTNSGSPSNLKNTLIEEDNVIYVGLASQTSPCIQNDGTWTNATATGNQCMRSGSSDGTNYTDVVYFSSSVGHLKIGNLWDDSNLGSDVRFGDGANVDVSPGSMIPLLRTAPTTGDYVEIGDLTAISGVSSPCANIAINANNVAKAYSFCIDASAGDAQYLAYPISSTGAVGGRNFELAVGLVGNIVSLRIHTTTSTFTEKFAITLTPWTVRNASGTPSKIRFVPDTDTATLAAPTTPLPSTPCKFEASSVTCITFTTLALSTPKITAGSGTGVTVNDAGSLRTQVYKLTLLSTNCIAAAVTCDFTVATLPAKTFLRRVFADLTTTYACASTCTTATLSATLGSSAGGTEFLASMDLDAATTQFGDVDGELGSVMNAAARAASGVNFDGVIMNWSSTTSVILRITSGTGNLGNGATTFLSQGTIVFYLETSIYP